MRGILYFLAEIRFPAHWRASSHFFVKISRLMCARDLGSGTGRAPPCSHSTPRASGFSAAIFAHSSAFSLPGTPLWAGHHRISMVIPGLALRSAASVAGVELLLFRVRAQAGGKEVAHASYSVLSRSHAVLSRAQVPAPRGAAVFQNPRTIRRRELQPPDCPISGSSPPRMWEGEYWPGWGGRPERDAGERALAARSEGGEEAGGRGGRGTTAAPPHSFLHALTGWKRPSQVSKGYPLWMTSVGGQKGPTQAR